MAIKKVLVVDDSATERHLLGEILGKQGFEVSFAEEGQKGVELSKLSPFGIKAPLISAVMAPL